MNVYRLLIKTLKVLNRKVTRWYWPLFVFNFFFAVELCALSFRAIGDGKTVLQVLRPTPENSSSAPLKMRFWKNLFTDYRFENYDNFRAVFWKTSYLSLHLKKTLQIGNALFPWIAFFAGNSVFFIIFVVNFFSNLGNCFRGVVFHLVISSVLHVQLVVVFLTILASICASEYNERAFLWFAEFIFYFWVTSNSCIFHPFQGIVRFGST